jgi:glycosyltransferase involved in cell wall biosynthesis
MPRVLYISPVLPRRHGRGLEQRAYRVIEALSHRYRVSLLTTASAEPGGTAASDAKSMCDDITVLPLRRWTAAALERRALQRFFPERYYAWYRQPLDWRAPTGADQKRLVGAYARHRFDLVHVHRLYMLPLLRNCPFLAEVPACMDLDDIESITRERLARLARLNGDRKIAYVMQQDAEAYRAIERRELARFERVFVCSEADRARLLAVAGLRRVDVLPNVVEIPLQVSRRPRRASGEPFVFLFVGTLDYYPNRDAVAFCCREVAPLIRKRVSRPFQIRIVSDGGREGRRQVPSIPEASWAPHNADLGREYGAADAAIVPIRAGGGTRIKALEAFAHRTAVVSTAIGVEGLDVEHGVHALIGETAADLALHAAAVMDDAALRGRLAERAFALVQTAYSPAVLRRRVDEVMGDSLRFAE